MKKSIFLFFAAILCAMTANAYNQSAKDLYFDNSEAKWEKCYVYIGKGDYTSCYDMTRVTGTQYLWQLPANFNGGSAWNGATGWVVCCEKWWASSQETIDKYTWHGDKKVTQKTGTAWGDTKIYKTNGTASTTSDKHTIQAYKVTSYTKSNYTVTINTVEGGTLTVKDYDDNAVATGASKIHLTVLKFSAAPASGYVLDGVEINDGTNTTTIAAADLATKTHTLTSAVTITPVWRATTSTVTVTATATNGTVTGGGVVEEGTSVTLTATPADGYKFVNWTVGGAEVSTANPYTFTAEEDVTVTANFEETPKATIYFVNNSGWSKIQAYAWGDKGTNASWAGVDITANKLSEKIGEFDVYSYTVEQGLYANVIFNDGSAQTKDYVWIDGNYYWNNEAKNFEGGTKADAETKFSVPVEYDYVYFINTNSWAAVNIYTWESEIATWPGVAMNKEAEQIAGFDVYSHKEVKGTTFGGMKFNEGKDKKETGNLTWQAGKYYAPSKDKWYDDAAAAESDLAIPLADETVYFVNNKKWANVAIYGWNGTLTDGTGANKWPGAAMTKTAEQVAGFDVYSYTAKEGTLKNILFNHNGDENKTSDFVWTNGKYYYMDAGAQKDKNYAGGTKEEVAEIVAIPVVDNYYVSGTFNGWASNDAAKLTLNGELYTKELTLEAGAHMFKVQKNNWAGEWGYSNIKGAYVGMEEGTNDDGDKNNNIKLTLSTKTTFTVKFNLAANEITFDDLTEEETETLVYTVEVPEGTEKCYIAGKMNNWEFALMTQKDATHWTITYDNVLKDMEYKYACQASWDYVEKDKDGNDLADNRTWKENDKVENWGKPIVVTYQLKGVGGWDQPGIELVQNPDPEKASEYMLTCQAISATDAIKVVRLENGEIKDYYGNGTVKDGVAVTVNYDSDGNITLPEGKYNFYFDTNESEKKLWIEAATDCEPTPDYTRTVGNNQFGTICLPFGGTITGAVLYECVGSETGKVYLGSVNTLTAGVPYIFQATATELAVYSDGTTAANPGNSNGLHGTFTNDTEVAVGNYILKGNALCQAATTCYVNANRAYLVMSEVPTGAPQQMPGRRYIGMSVQGENEATGVEDIFSTDAPVKVIDNGQLIIIRDGVKYNVQGQVIK